MEEKKLHSILFEVATEQRLIFVLTFDFNLFRLANCLACLAAPQSVDDAAWRAEVDRRVALSVEGKCERGTTL